VGEARAMGGVRVFDGARCSLRTLLCNYLRVLLLTAADAAAVLPACLGSFPSYKLQGIDTSDGLLTVHRCLLHGLLHQHMLLTHALLPLLLAARRAAGAACFGLVACRTPAEH
jgi:hypothetical protein